MCSSLYQRLNSSSRSSGTSLEAQKRYSDGIRDCLENFFADEPIDRDYIIVEGGRVTSPSYSYAYEG